MPAQGDGSYLAKWGLEGWFLSRGRPPRELLEPLKFALPLDEGPLKEPRERDDRSRSDLEEEDDGSFSWREEDDFLSLLNDGLKEGFVGFLAEETETTAEVSLGMDLAISIWADLEASSEVLSANSRMRSLLNSFSDDKDDERRDFRCSSDNEGGRSRAKCSLLRSRRKANMDDDRAMVSATELPKNLLMEFQREGSTGSKSVLLISLESTSSIHPTYD